MIYTPPPDTFSYLEPLDDMEQLGKKYWEVKDNKEELDKLFDYVKSSNNTALQRAFVGMMQEVDFMTLFDDFYQDEITVWKHPRFMECLLHDHNFFEMVYVLKGKAGNIINGQLYKMSEADICIIAPGVQHKLEVVDDSILINVIIKKSLFDESFFKRLSQDKGIVKFIKQNYYMPSMDKRGFLMFHALHNNMQRSALALLFSEAFNGQNNPNTKASLLTVILEYLAENEDETHEAENCEFSEKILRYIQENYQSTSLSDAARHFNYSEPHLSKLIKESIGVPFKTILQEVRIKEACHLFATTEYTIAQIADMIGYKSPVYLSRVFKKKMEVTPDQYRRMHKEKMYLFEGLDVIKNR